MLHRYQDKEKSLTRRFLLILGVVTLICVFGLGAMIIFWDKIPLDLSKSQKILFGSLIIVYAVLRFSRLLKKRPDEE
jgi:hypothetical protein